MLFLLKIKWLRQLLFKLFVDRMICENTSITHTPYAGFPNVQLYKMRMISAIVVT